jgi:hypothetical protein
VGVWWAALTANVVAAVVGVFWFRIFFRKLEIDAPAETGPAAGGQSERTATAEPEPAPA